MKILSIILTICLFGLLQTNTILSSQNTLKTSENQTTSSNIVLLRFAPNTPTSQINSYANLYGSMSTMYCPNGDVIWVLPYQIGPNGRQIGTNGNGEDEDEDDVDINSMPELIYYKLNGSCSGGDW